MEAFLSNLFFTVLVLVTVIPALMVVLTLNIVRAASWLLLSLAGAAGLFFFLGADFVGATQLMIYVGGTLVLVIFGVMLTATGPFVNLASRGGDWFLGLLAGSILFALLAYCIATHSWSTTRAVAAYDQKEVSGTTNRIGMSLLGFSEKSDDPAQAPVPGGPYAGPAEYGYLLPFEIVSVHLVVVLIGAAYLARAKQRRAKEA